MAIDKKINYNKPIVQGGVDNYLGKQPQVQAPRKWQSSPDKPATELAYITEAEKDLILKSNIHGGLEGGPNMGPSGIMSLDSFGDVGGGGASGGDTSAGGGYDTGAGGGGFSGQGPNENRQDFANRKDAQRAALQIAERAQAQDLGYNERANIANATYGPLQKYTGERGFLGNLFRGANKYGYTDTYTSGPNQGQVKPGYFGRAIGGLGSLLTGIPFVGSAIGSMYDKGKGIFGRKPRDMSEFNKLSLYDDSQKQKAFYDNALYSDNYSDMKINQKPNLNNLESLINATNLNDFEGYDLGLDIAPGYEGNGILDLETDNIYKGIEDHSAFKPNSKKDKRLRTLHNQKTEGLFWNDQNKKEYEQLLKEDAEQTEYPKSIIT